MTEAEAEGRTELREAALGALSGVHLVEIAGVAPARLGVSGAISFSEGGKAPDTSLSGALGGSSEGVVDALAGKTSPADILV